MSEAKRLFVLVDQSVKKPGGHHYEYAQRILNAARALGYDTLLLAHKDYQGKVDHDVRPTFSLTFWDNYRHYYAGPSRSELGGLFGLLIAGRDRARGLLLGGKRRMLYSRVGLALARARHLPVRDIILKPHLNDDFSTIRSGRSLLMIAKMSRIVKRIGSRVNRKLRLHRILTMLFGIIAAPIAIPAIGLLWLVRKDPAKIFSAEIGKILEAERKDTVDTLVFVPNATAAELDALALLVQRQHHIAEAHWAFLFRRPVFTGYSAGFSQQAEHARRHRMELARLHMTAPEIRAHFYTDTAELTEQYNFLGVCSFTTLPVPVDPMPARPAKTERPLVLGYLGDARDEKGFQHLPRLVEAFSPRDGEQPRARFLFQSNFNTPGGEPGSRYARGILEMQDSSFVELVEGPFDSREYAALLERMDIILIPYDSVNYSARSSGVLMEALSSGLPVLAPTCSWMAGLAEPLRQKHLRTVFGQFQPASRMRKSPEELIGEAWPTDTATHLLLRMRFGSNFKGFVRVYIKSTNEFGFCIANTQQSYKVAGEETLAAFEVPRSANIHCTIKPVGPGGLNLIEADLEFFALPERVPLDAGVALFDVPEDIALIAGGLVDFYDHHKQSAEQLRRDLKPLYDPVTLVSHLAEQAFGMLPAVSVNPEIRSPLVHAVG